MKLIKYLTYSCLFTAIAGSTLALKYPDLLLFKRGKNDTEKAIFKRIKFNEAIVIGKINVVTIGCDISKCKPIKKEVKQLGSKIVHWKKNIDFDYSVVVYLNKDYDNKDSSSLYSSAFVSSFMSNSHKWQFPFYFYYYDSNESALEDIFGFKSTPTTIVFDKTGKIYYKTNGMISSESDLTKLYKKISELK